MTVIAAEQQLRGTAPKRRPTICALIHRMGIGGAEVLASQMARDLSERYRFVFACMDEVGPLGEELIQSGSVVTCLQRRPGIDLQCAARLRRFMEDEQVDLVHAHQYTSFFQALVARRLGRRPPIVFTEHGRHVPDLPSWKRGLFNRAMLGRSDRVVGVGQSVRDALICIEGLPASRVSVIYNGIPLQRFRHDKSRAEAFRTSHRSLAGVSDSDFVLIQVARLDYLKDHITAINTVREMVERGRPVRLLLVGEGPRRPEIEDHIASLQLQEHVTLLGERRDVGELLPMADALLLTSINEGIPLTVIEAMAAGLPVVATHVGGLPEIVDDGVTGFLAPAKDPVALADRIECLMESPELRQHFGERGQTEATRRFSIEAMHQGYCRLYEELLNG